MPDIRLTLVDESIFKTISAGKFASGETYRLRLWAEYAQTETEDPFELAG